MIFPLNRIVFNVESIFSLDSSRLGSKALMNAWHLFEQEWSSVEHYHLIASESLV